MQTPTSRQEPFIFEKLVNIKNKFLSIFVIFIGIFIVDNHLFKRNLGQVFWIKQASVVDDTLILVLMDYCRTVSLFLY